MYRYSEGRNKLRTIPAKLGKLTGLVELDLTKNRPDSIPAEWRAGGQLEKGGCAVAR